MLGAASWLVDAVGAAVVVTDPSGRILSWNPAATELYDWSAAEMRGRDIREIMPEATAMLDALGSGRRWSRECDLQRRDGALQPALVTSTPVAGPDGVVGIVIVAVDLGERTSREQDLRRSRDQLEFTLQSVADGITVQDADGQVIFANQAAVRLTGYESADALLRATPEELTRRFTLMDEDGRPLPLDRLPGRRALAGEPAPEAVIRFRTHATGEDRWSLVKARPVHNPDGSVAMAINVFQDITELKQAEQALRQREAQFESLADNVPDIIARFDRELRHVYVNRAIEQVTGRSRSAFIGKTHEDLGLSPAHYAYWTAALRQVFETGTPRLIEFEFPTPTGTRSFQTKIVPEVAADGSVPTALGITRDITDHRRAEERARFLAEASAILSSSLDYTTTLQSLARLAVPRLADWCAVDTVEEEGEVARLAVAHLDPARLEWAHELQRRYPDDPDAPYGIPAVLRTGQPEFYPRISDEMLVEAARDAEHLALLRRIGFRSVIIAPLVARGRVLGAITFVTAESGRHYTEADLSTAIELARRAALAVDNARLYQEAQIAIRAREEFLSIASHELKTPLTALKGYVQILLRHLTRPAPDPERLLWTATQLEKQSDRLERLIADLLDVSRLHRGQLELNREPVDLRDLARQVLLRFEYVAEGPDELRLVLDAPAPVWGYWDPARLDQVLTNLVSNAVKFSPRGGEIRVRVERTGDHARLSVADQGIGIDPDDRRRLFQPFMRGTTPNGQVGGIGLGLYITFQIVARHGGTIEVQSRPGAGSTFTVLLPREVERLAEISR